MGKHFKVNDNLLYTNNANASKNVFLGRKAVDVDLPTYEGSKHLLPRPIWEGREDIISCYDKTWKIAFDNLKKANHHAGFVSDFIDTAFNGYLFMWDSSFIVMFGKYGNRAFDFQQTLDNFYSHQHKDGFICREICEDEEGEQFTRDDPASTGPNILPYAEWEHFLANGDVKRLSEVFDPLCAYHKWLQLNRSWQDGSYWSCGLSCGMDNQPRHQPGFDPCLSHGFMSWIDTCAQQYLSADILIKMAEVLGREREVDWLKDEKQLLGNTINNKMWSEHDAYYYDTYRDGSLSGVKSVGAYWTLLAGLVSDERADRFIAHLDNENEFKRYNRVPSLSADNPNYRADGGYWLGGVWAPTDYMVLCGLNKYGRDRLAHEIAVDFLQNVVEVYTETGTLYENYAPEYAAAGVPSKSDFVGWTGLAPISIMFEYVFGIHPDAMSKTITWNVFLTDKHGIENYPLGDATIDLICEKRDSEDEEPQITVRSDIPVHVKVNWKSGSKVIDA